MKRWKKVLIGFGAGVVVLLFLPLILLLLFTRLKYAAVARVGEGTTVRVKASYFFRFITVRYLFRKEESISQVRVLGIRVAGGRQAAEKTPAENPVKKPRGGATKVLEKNGEQKTEPPPGGLSLRRVLTYPELKIIITLTCTCMKRFLRTLLPKRLDISGTVGFEDPAATGMFLGAYESVAAIFGLRERVRLAADFAEPGVKLRIAASGKISAARLMRPFVSLLIKKPVRRFIRFLLKG